MYERPRRSRSISAPNHVPPLELIPTLDKPRRKYVATEKFDIPLADHNIPNPIPYLIELGSRIIYSPEYEQEVHRQLSGNEGPRIANVDHLAYPRPVYDQFGKNSYQNKYREGTGIKVEMFIPFHNLGHHLRYDPPTPENSVMKERTREHEEVKSLYHMASTALWLDDMYNDGARDYRSAEAFIQKWGYRADKEPTRRRSLPSRCTVLDRLDKIRPGTMGILPDFERLATLDLRSIVAELAIWGAQDTIMTAEESTAIIFEASRKASGYDLVA